MESKVETPTGRKEMLALDIGFGDTKYCFSNGQTLEINKLPTAIETLNESVGNISGFVTDEEFYFDGTRYAVGERGVRKAKCTEHIDFLTKYSPLLAYAAVARVERITKQRVETLVIGLPLSYFDVKTCGIFTNNLSRIDVNRVRREFEVEIMPQGIGALLDYQISASYMLRPEARINMLIVDIGFNTIDILGVTNGAPDRQALQTLERRGVVRVVDQLSTHLSNRFHANYSDSDVKGFLQDGSLTHTGNRYDLRFKIQELQEEYSNEIFEFLKSKYSDLVRDSKVVLFVGGGAHFLKNYVPAEWRGLCHFPTDPEYANVRGYYKGIIAKLNKRA